MKFETILEAKKAAGIQADMTEVKQVLHEVIGALMCEDQEIRALTRDFVLLYLAKLEKEHKVPK